MLSIAPACYHAISLTARPPPSPPSQPPWPPPPLIHTHTHTHTSVSPLTPLLYVDRWVTAVLNVSPSDRGHTGNWRDAKGTSADYTSPQYQHDGHDTRVCMEISFLCVWWEETIDSQQSLSLCSGGARQVKVTGESTRIQHLSEATKAIHGRSTLCKSPHKQTLDLIALPRCLKVCVCVFVC